MNNKITFEIEAKFNTKDTIKKVKKIKKHARKMEKLAREIGYFLEEDAHVAVTRKSPANAVRYGIKIRKNEKDPTKRVSYIFDAEGMTPAHMDFEKGVFDYGTWRLAGFMDPALNYPCMVNYDGSEVYKLDPNDYAKKEDGSTSDIVNPQFPGNAMAAFVGGYLAQYEDAEYEYIIWSNVKYDKRYNCFHREDTKGRELTGFYYRIYTPANIDGKARSLSCLEPTRNNTAYDEEEMIELNGLKWSGLTWSRYNYIISLLMILGKTEDLRATYGTGNSRRAWSDSSPVLEGGRLNKKGQFFGTNDGKEQIKVFHIEALWGNQFTRCLGLIAKGKKILVSPHGPYNLTGDNYEVMAESKIEGFEYGFVDKTQMTKYGRVAQSFEGSEKTFTCNFGAIDTNGETEVAVVGGYAHGGARCGFCVDLIDSPSLADWNIAPGLSCEMPLKA